MRHDGYIMVVAAIACENVKKEIFFSLPRALLTVKILISKVGRQSLVIPPFHSFSCCVTLSVPFARAKTRERERAKYSA